MLDETAIHTSCLLACHAGLIELSSVVRPHEMLVFDATHHHACLSCMHDSVWLALYILLTYAIFTIRNHSVFIMVIVESSLSTLRLKDICYILYDIFH